MPLDLDRLPLAQRVRLGAEVLATYTRVRFIMRDDDAERAVARLRIAKATHPAQPAPDLAQLAPDPAQPAPDLAQPAPDLAQPAPDPAEPVPDPADPAPDDEFLTAWRLAYAAGRVLRLLPTDSRCLFRSLTVMCLLDRRGIEQTLVIAVRPKPFAAHAWIEVGGQAVLPDGEPGYERLLEL